MHDILITREGNALATLGKVASNALELTGIFQCEITPEAPTADSRYHFISNGSETVKVTQMQMHVVRLFPLAYY
jgi:hypothetical protein